MILIPVKREFYMGYVTWVAQHFNDHTVHVTDDQAKVYRGFDDEKRQVSESNGKMEIFKINQADKEDYERSYHHFLEIDVKKAFSDKEVLPMMNYLWSYFLDQGHVKTDWLLQNKDGLLALNKIK